MKIRPILWICLILVAGVGGKAFYDSSLRPSGKLSAKQVQAELNKVEKLNAEKNFPKDTTYTEEIVGIYGENVVARIFKCFGDVCPDNGGYFLIYKDVEEGGCATIGGEPIFGYGWGKVYGGCGVVLLDE